MDKILSMLKNFCDDFVLFGRILPVIMATLPVIIYGIFEGYITDKKVSIPFYGGIFVLILIGMGKVVRIWGKNVENEMYEKLGAKPTTIVLRYSDSTIDMLTKTRYHKYINEKIKDMDLPIMVDDENEKSDIFYESAMNYLRKYANAHKDSEQRVYQDLKEYNFWRNLYGCKWIAIIMYAIIAVRELCLIDNFNVKDMFLNMYPTYVMFVFMIICIMLMCIVVNKNIVKQRAFEYAKSLAEVCERFVEV